MTLHYTDNRVKYVFISNGLILVNNFGHSLTIVPIYALDNEKIKKKKKRSLWKGIQNVVIKKWKRLGIIMEELLKHCISYSLSLFGRGEYGGNGKKRICKE